MYTYSPNALYTSDSSMCTSANSEDIDEMQNAAFHGGLHCLLGKKKYDLQRKIYIIVIYLKIPSIYTMYHPGVLYQIKRKNPSVSKRLKGLY